VYGSSERRAAIGGQREAGSARRAASCRGWRMHAYVWSAHFALPPSLICPLSLCAAYLVGVSGRELWWWCAMVGVRARWMKCESAAAAAAACLCLQRRRIAAERSNDCVLRRGQRANLKDQTAGIKADLAVKRTENRGLLLLPKEQRDGNVRKPTFVELVKLLDKLVKREVSKGLVRKIKQCSCWPFNRLRSAVHRHTVGI